MYLDMLYIATCYLPYAFLLFFAVLIFPALSFFPSLIRTPALAAAIPIVSLLIISSFAFLLFKLGIYHHDLILISSLLFTGLGALRTYLYQRHHTLRWQKWDYDFLWLNLGLLLPLIAFNGISSFMTYDALQSWNYWALHFYHGEIPDTLGYPPFLPLFISYCYHLLGHTEYQGAVKALFFVFPFSVMNAIAFASDKIKQSPLLYLLLIGACVFPGFFDVHVYRSYSVGLADPMLAAAIATSLMLFLIYLKNPHEKSYLFFAVLCAITASLSKQPGLLWACISLPLLLLIRCFYLKKIDSQTVFSILLLWLPATIWLLGPGSHFYNNSGVISASLHQEHITLWAMLKTLKVSIVTYLFLKPALLILLVAAAFTGYKNRYHCLILFLFLFPALLCWFIFGSYAMRLGLYILGAAGVLIAGCDHFLATAKNSFTPHFLKVITVKRLRSACLLLGVGSFIIFSFTDQENGHINIPNRIYPLNAGLSNIYAYYGQQAKFVYKTIYDNPHVSIWAPHRFVAGIFYGHTKIVPLPKSYAVKDVYQNLQTYTPDYVLVAFCNRDSWDCNAIGEVIKHYPGLLTQIPLGKSDHDYRMYSLNKTYFKN